ncbi:MAG: thioredoxin domain-containing protein [Candidatus Acidiferrales bacterium]
MLRILNVLATAGVVILAAAFPSFAQSGSQTPPQAPTQTTVQAPAQTSSPEESQFLKTAEVFVRKLFAWGPDFQLKLGPLGKSPAPEFYLVPIEVTFNGTSDAGVLYISKDGKTVVRGEMFDTSADPFAGNRARLQISGSPSRGPADARVTIVEFSDFQCPHCRQLYENMKILTEHYPQVRIVFKNFPLVAIHPWAMTAAIGGHCAFQQSPEAFWKVHDGLFENQDLVTTADVWERLVAYASQAGIDKDAFKACMASPEAKQAIEADIAEAQVLSVNSTPTAFVNGRPVVGGEPSTLQQYIDYELGDQHGAKPSSQHQPGQVAPESKPAAKPSGKP